MRYDESQPAEVPASDEFDRDTVVHIRQMNIGVMKYAVFDGEEQVSPEYGPLNDEDCLMFAKGYKKGREKYNGN